MGSCPVCLKSLLEEFAEPQKNNFTKEQKKRQAQLGSNPYGPKGAIGTTKTAFIVPQEEVVVATKCGHLFHKVCLRDYLVTFRQLTRQTFVECPICQERIILSSTLVVDLRANDGCTEKTDKELKHAEIMKKELEGQLEDVQKKFAVVNREIQDGILMLEVVQSQQNNNLEEWNYKQSILNEIDDLHCEINKHKESSNLLKRENLELAGIYMCMLSNDVFSSSTIPHEILEPLLPHVRLIRENRDLLKKFLKIVAPLRFPKNTVEGQKRVPTEAELVSAILERIKIINPEPEPEPDPKPETTPEEESGTEIDSYSSNTESYEESCRSYDDRPGPTPTLNPDSGSTLQLEGPISTQETPTNPVPATIREPPRRPGRAPNNFLHGVQTVLTVMVDENKATSSEVCESDPPPLPDLTKQRKFRSKITDKWDKQEVLCSTKDKIYAGQGVKHSKARRRQKNCSATTILVSPTTDYSKLVRTRKSKRLPVEAPVLPMEELFRRQSNSLPTLQVELPAPELSSKDLVQPQESLSKSDQMIQPDSNDSLEPGPILSPAPNKDPILSVLEKIEKQMVSTGSQMSDHDFPVVPIPAESKVSIQSETDPVLKLYTEPTFRFSSVESKAEGPDFVKVPKFNVGVRKYLSSYSSGGHRRHENSSWSSSTSCSNSSTSNRSRTKYNPTRRTQSSGFEINHLSIVDYFGSTNPTEKFSLESLITVNNVTSIVDECGEHGENVSEEAEREFCENRQSQLYLATRQESTFFTPSVFSQDELEEKSTLPDSAFMLDLTDLPPAEELYGNFNFSRFELPPPLDLIDDIPPPLILSQYDLPQPLNMIPPLFPTDSFFMEEVVPESKIFEDHSPSQNNIENHKESDELLIPSAWNLSPSEDFFEKGILPSAATADDELCQKSLNDQNNDLSLRLHPTFSEQLAALTVRPPPPLSASLTNFTEEHGSVIRRNTSRAINEAEDPNVKLLKGDSILDWLPEPTENLSGSFPEIEPEIAMLIQSRQAHQLKSQNQRTILKVRRATRRRIV